MGSPAILTLPDAAAWEALDVSPDDEEVTRYGNHATYLARRHYFTSMGEYPGLTVHPDHVDYLMSPSVTVRAFGKIVGDDGDVIESYYE